MPTYNLVCPKCGYKWSEFMWLSERENAKCPKCEEKAETDYEAQLGIILIKGKGFYQESQMR